MDPQYEEMLRNEVIYLHSLWHQGPPGRPAAIAAPTQPHCHTESTQFNITNPDFNTKKRKCIEFPENSFQESDSSTGAKWPCPTPPPPTTGWQIAKKHPDNPTELSPEERLILLAKHSQQRALTAVKKFFTGNSNSDAIGSSSEEDDSDDERDECSFLRNLLRDDTELREYYRSNVARGIFSCLVCEGVGGRGAGKKYQDCLALVQHSISISKTKKKRAHRAFALAICEVLGCDIGHLPSVASMLSESNVDFENKKRSIELLSNDGAAPECQAVASSQGNVDFDNKNSSITFVRNVDSENEQKPAELQVDSLEGNIGVVMESGASVSLPTEQGTQILARQIDMVWRSLQNRGALNGSNVVGGILDVQKVEDSATEN